MSLELWGEKKIKKSDFIKVDLVQMWAVTAAATLSYVLIVGRTKGQKQQQQERNWRSQHSSFFFLELKITPGKLQPETGAAFRSPCCLYVQAAGEGLCAEISSGCLMSCAVNTPPMVCGPPVPPSPGRDNLAAFHRFQLSSGISEVLTPFSTSRSSPGYLRRIDFTSSSSWPHGKV